MKERIKNWFRWLFKKQILKSSLKELFDHIHTDENGKKWYAYKNPLAMGYSRLMAFQEAQKWLSMGVTREMAIERYTVMLDLFNKNKLSDVIFLCGDLLRRAQMPIEKESLIECCSIYFIHQDEPIAFDATKNLYDEIWKIKKREMIANDAVLQHVFFSSYLQRLSAMDESSLRATLHYLTESTKMGETMDKAISSLCNSNLKNQKDSLV